MDFKSVNNLVPGFFEIDNTKEIDHIFLKLKSLNLFLKNEKILFISLRDEIKKIIDLLIEYLNNNFETLEKPPEFNNLKKNIIYLKAFTCKEEKYYYVVEILKFSLCFCLLKNLKAYFHEKDDLFIVKLPILEKSLIKYIRKETLLNNPNSFSGDLFEFISFHLSSFIQEINYFKQFNFNVDSFFLNSFYSKIKVMNEESLNRGDIHFALLNSLFICKLSRKKEHFNISKHISEFENIQPYEKIGSILLLFTNLMLYNSDMANSLSLGERNTLNHLISRIPKPNR